MASQVPRNLPIRHDTWMCNTFNEADNAFVTATAIRACRTGRLLYGRRGRQVTHSHTEATLFERPNPRGSAKRNASDSAGRADPSETTDTAGNDAKAAAGESGRKKQSAASRKRRAKRRQTRAAREATHASGIAVHGVLAAPIGIGESARRSAEALLAANVPVSTHCVEMPGISLRVPFPESSPDAPEYDTELYHLQPGRTLSRRAKGAYGKRRIAYWHWELPVFPPQWAARAHVVDEVWVPSQFVAGLVKAAVPHPVRLVPHPAVVVPMDRLEARRALGLPRTRRIILTAFDFRSFWQRKNPEAVIRAFKDAFPDGADAPLLVVKYHRSEEAVDADQIARIRATPNVLVIDRSVSHEEMRQIYAASDALISLHRSEGFGLHLLDMMALGRACVATGFSGNLDFMTAENSILIPWTMRAVQPGEYILDHGQWWADPDHDASVEALRWLGTASDSALDALAGRARKDINRDYSMKAVGRLAHAAWTGEMPPWEGSS